jgi:hypothetical protein
MQTHVQTFHENNQPKVPLARVEPDWQCLSCGDGAFAVTAHAFLQIVAIRPLLVRLVPASTIRPRRANSIRLGLTVLAFMLSSFVISSSVLGVRHRNS